MFNEATISLNLDKYAYKPGETIKGKLNLNCSKAIKGEKLEISFIGAIIKTSTHNSSSHFDDDLHHFDEEETFTTAEPFYDYKIILDGEKEYTNHEYNFEFKIPVDAIEKQPKFEGWLKKAMNFSKKLGGHPPYAEWFVQAQLYIPWKIDIYQKQKIEIL